MVSDAELADITQFGYDIVSIKLLVVGVTALLVYDYFLTLKDEVQYAWKSESVLIFVLFLFTRYLPVVFQVWFIVMFSDTRYTYEMCVCKKSAFAEIIYYTLIATSAQIVLAQRTYAITGKNKWVGGVLYTLCAVQFCTGAFEFIWSALSKTANMPAIPLIAFRICLPGIERISSLLQMFLSLVFDVTVFAIILVKTHIIKSRHLMNRSRILNTVSRDAEIYFVIITTCHFLIVVMILAARPGVGAIPILGNSVFIPMMICRMIMSLKKVSAERPSCTSAEVGLPVDTNSYLSRRPADTIQLAELAR